MSPVPVSPCTTAPAGDTMIVAFTEDSDSSLDGGGNVRDEVFFFFAPVVASCLCVWKLSSRLATFRVSAFVELNLDCDVGDG